MERRPQSVRIYGCRGRVSCSSRSSEEVLRKEIDALVHENHDLRFYVVSRGGTRNKCHCCTRNEVLVEIYWRDRGRHSVLWVRKNFAHGPYRYIDLPRCRIFEVANIVEVWGILEEQRIRRSRTGSLRLR